jgi:hypothetical protein
MTMAGSPQKEAYFEARTAQIKLQTEREQEQMGYDTIIVKLSAVMSCSKSMMKVAYNLGIITKGMQGTEFEEDAKKQASDMWDLAKKMQEELDEMASQPAPKRA